MPQTEYKTIIEDGIEDTKEYTASIILAALVMIILLIAFLQSRLYGIGSLVLILPLFVHIIDEKRYPRPSAVFRTGIYLGTMGILIFLPLWLVRTTITMSTRTSPLPDVSLYPLIGAVTCSITILTVTYIGTIAVPRENNLKKGIIAIQQFYHHSIPIAVLLVYGLSMPVLVGTIAMSPFYIFDTPVITVLGETLPVSLAPFFLGASIGAVAGIRSITRYYETITDR